MSAVTDSIGKINIDKENQPGLYNLMEIASSLSGESIEDIANKFKDSGYGDFKKFDIYDVLDTINEKMIRRHPHVFGNSKATSDEEIRKEWEKIKAEEKQNKNH